MRRHLKEFVRTELFPGRALPPSTSRRFYPTKKDIHNHMYRAIVKNRFSNCDQTNVGAKINLWQAQYPSDKFHFRPFEEINSSNEDAFTDDDDYDDDDEEEEIEVKVTKPITSQKLLFVHQTSWQQRLLSMYGNNICLLDATYKTTRYSLPLFFLAVKTNVDYQVVASFIIQNESTDSIKEALGILKQWNPVWNPPFFMTDFSEEEITAVEETFPDCTVYLCDFHREQAWERWVNKKDNGVSGQKEEVLSKLRQIARASTEEIYQKAVFNLKDSQLWKRNIKIQKWFGNKWIKASKRWVWAFREEGFAVMVNTNNGLERQNKLFKYSYLHNHKNTSLSGMLNILIENSFQRSTT
ncbi:hypothetical protein QZH41_016829, partial [Actinostola sp. cb2023]